MVGMKRVPRKRGDLTRSGGDFCCMRPVSDIPRRVHLRPTFVLFALSFHRVSVSVIDCWLLLRPGRPFVTRRDRSTTRSSDRDLSSTSPFIVIHAFYVCTCVRVGATRCARISIEPQTTDLQTDRSFVWPSFGEPVSVGKQEARNSK